MKRNKIILIILILSITALVFSGCDEGFVTSPIPDDEEISDIIHAFLHLAL